jgi:hypothetical protein
MPPPSDPGQRELDQINLDSHWNNILRMFRSEKGRRFNIGALLRCARPEICDEREDSIHLVFSNEGMAVRAKGEFGPSGKVVGLIKLALLVATGNQYEHIAVEYRPTGLRQTVQELPW